jgi:DNA primase small subunit
VCVPINPEKVEDFDPSTVPTLPQLMRELDEYDEEMSGKVKHEWEKTSLKESFSHFQKEFMTPMWKQMKKVERSREEERAALLGDF